MNPIGVMQGRLTPSRGRGIQFFPFGEWEEEFSRAAAIGLQEIEFIFDLDRYTENPLWNREGRRRIQERIRETGVKVNTICADFFMRRPFFRVSDAIWGENVRMLNRLIGAASEISCRGVEIPLVDNSSLRSKRDEDRLIAALTPCISTARSQGVFLGLEMDYPPKKFLQFLERCNDPMVRANYDTGNSAGSGYDTQEEIQTLGNYIANIHIKDRVRGGGTVELGRGGAEFHKTFQELAQIPYTGSFILQVARGPDGKETQTVETQLSFAQKLRDQYLTPS